jgi:hypothetical protein
MKTRWFELVSTGGQPYWSFPFRKDSLLKLFLGVVQAPTRGLYIKNLQG